MKNLNKRIVVVVLLSVLVLGGYFSNGFVAHAKIHPDKFVENLLDKVREIYIYDYYVELMEQIIKLGEEKNFMVIVVDPEESFINGLEKQYSYLKNPKKYGSYLYFQEEVEEMLKNKVKGYYRFQVDFLDIIIQFL